jgi:hypothetical protein
MTECEVFINGRPMYISRRLLTRDDLIVFAGFDPHQSDAAHLTVQWTSDSGEVGGTVDDDTTFKVIEGARVDVFYPPAEEPTRGPLSITVAGFSGAGKTAILIAIANMLLDRGFTDLVVDWGVDGNPHRSNAINAAALASIAKHNPRINLKEVQFARDGRPVRTSQGS